MSGRSLSRCRSEMKRVAMNRLSLLIESRRSAGTELLRRLGFIAGAPVAGGLLDRSFLDHDLLDRDGIRERTGFAIAVARSHVAHLFENFHAFHDRAEDSVAPAGGLRIQHGIVRKIDEELCIAAVRVVATSEAD